jgi:membrane-associated protein
LPLPGLLSRHRRVVLLVGLLLLGVVLFFAGKRSLHGLRQLFDGPAPPAGDRHWLLRWLDSYGLPLVFGVMVVAAAGIPLPANLLLLAMGAAAAEGKQSAWVVFGVALAGLVLGDHLGYLVGDWGGRWLVGRLAGLLGAEEQLPRARETLQERGWMAVFLTRWLLLPLGSPCNWVCGSMGYPLRRFFVADVLGEGLYVAIFLLLGMAFSEQIDRVARVAGTAGYGLAGLVLVALVAWRFVRAQE